MLSTTQVYYLLLNNIFDKSFHKYDSLRKNILHYLFYY